MLGSSLVPVLRFGSVATSSVHGSAAINSISPASIHLLLGFPLIASPRSLIFSALRLPCWRAFQNTKTKIIKHPYLLI